MSSPPHHTTAHVDLTDAEFAMAQSFADRQGLNIEEAVTRLASSAMAMHYHLAQRRKPAQVIQLVPKRNFSVTEKVKP